MSFIRKTLAVTMTAAISLAAVSACSGTEEESPKPVYEGTIGQKIDAFYQDHIDTAAGMAVAVFDENGVNYQGYYGYSNLEEQTPVDENTVFDWGSSTKTLVWVSVMQLWEQGKIDLEEDIREYLPEGFLTNLRYDTPIRMIDLMNHRAGFQEYYTDMFLRPQYDFLSLEDALQIDQPVQIFEPDTVTAYSNWGVALAGYIVERVSGMNFCDYVHENIFEPLGMEHSALAPDLSDNGWVRGQRENLMCYAGKTPLGNAFYLIELYPAGSCVSTLEDYITYASSFVQDECPLFGDPGTFDVMMSATSYYGNTGVVKNAHGFWALPYGSNTYGHGGNTQGCSSYITFDPEQQTGAVVMTNQLGEGYFNGDMFELIYGESAWDGPAADGLQEGFYHPARTVLKGHFKIMGAAYVTQDELSDFAWSYNENDGIAKIEYPYGDYYLVPAGAALFEVILIYSAVIGIIFAVISLIVKLIRFIIGKIRKKPFVVPLGRWSAAVSFIEVLIVFNIALLAVLITAWVPHNAYLWIFPVITVFMVMLIILTSYGIRNYIHKRKQMSVIRRIYNVLVSLFAVIDIVLLIYMQIWR